MSTESVENSRETATTAGRLKRLVSWLHDELATATKKKNQCLEDDDVQGYQFYNGYLNALHDIAKRL